jgi:hypothetical protein
MVSCTICHFDTELDDVAIAREVGARGICLRCYGQATGTARPLPATLRRALGAALAAIDQAALAPRV